MLYSSFQFTPLYPVWFSNIFSQVFTGVHTGIPNMLSVPCQLFQLYRRKSTYFPPKLHFGSKLLASDLGLCVLELILTVVIQPGGKSCILANSVPPLGFHIVSQFINFEWLTITLHCTWRWHIRWEIHSFFFFFLGFSAVKISYNLAMLNM